MTFLEAMWKIWHCFWKDVAASCSAVKILGRGLEQWCVSSTPFFLLADTYLDLQLELMRRKQSMQHFDQRQLLLLENAYYQVCRELWCADFF